MDFSSFFSVKYCLFLIIFLGWFSVRSRFAFLWGIEDLQREWIVLKIIVKPIYENNAKAKYLDIWGHIFTIEETVKECDNFLHLIEILLITSFSNAKLERMFSRMWRVKNDWRNKLGHDRLEGLLRISEEGPSLGNSNPDIAIESWYN